MSLKIKNQPASHKLNRNICKVSVILQASQKLNRSEFLDYHLKPVMQSGRSYIRDSGDFLKKLKI